MKYIKVEFDKGKYLKKFEIKFGSSYYYLLVISVIIDLMENGKYDLIKLILRIFGQILIKDCSIL